MKKIIIILLPLLIFGIFSACKQHPDEIPDDKNGDSTDPDETVSVCAAGYYNNGTNDIAAYWLDGTKTDLTDGTQNARAHAVYVYNGDVYVAGFEGPKNAETACYWKNGSKVTEFTSGSEDRGEAKAIWVDASGVYVTGFYRTSNNETIWYWDGSEHTLLSDNSDSDVPGLFVSSGDIYVAGHFDDGSIPYVAGYWKNGGTPNSYSTHSYGYDIFVSDTSEVFLAGEYWNSGTAAMVACYWTNEVFTKTDLYTAAASRATSVYVSSGTVYTAGYFGAAGSETACYWEGTVKTDLDDGSPVNARALDIQVVSGSVYIAGFYYDGDNKIACYWKDGVKSDLYDSGQSSVPAEASSIFVY